MHPETFLVHERKFNLQHSPSCAKTLGNCRELSEFYRTCENSICTDVVAFPDVHWMNICGEFPSKLPRTVIFKTTAKLSHDIQRQLNAKKGRVLSLLGLTSGSTNLRLRVIA